MQIKYEDPQAVEEFIQSMAADLKEKISKFDIDSVMMLGIHTGGYWVAEKLHQELQLPSTLGSLNISFYRDDFTNMGLHPEVKPSEIPHDIEDKHIILVDDVLYTGRTVRAALNEIFDYGRPASVIFAALVDRNEQELPICSEVTGVTINLSKGQQIKLSGPEPLVLKKIAEKE
ncbi:MAG: bifunctional pyr operon transcriptional regulator/uracil phosphoribosyltransferase PyrR [Gammaproteobacteria bacterium]|nr:bifunctional pyr operon transcriptional regulator/uracil phosphoribosyltransferase PyrR [Gammaproteobacteria bacterium]